MGTIINLFALLIITYLLYSAIQSRGRQISDPTDESTTIFVDNYEYFFILLFSTGVIQCGDFLAIRLFILELLCLYVIFSCRRNVIVSWPLGIYITYMIWLCLGCTYSNAPMYGFRMILKYVYPLLVAIMASQIVSNHDVLHISFYKARKMALITAISGAVPLIDRIELLVIPGLFWYGTARAIHFISISCICLALYYYAEDMDKRNRNIAYALMLPCVIWIFRTSIMGTACAMAFFAFFRNGYKSLFKIVAIGLALLIFLFSLPSMQKKMFRGEARFSIESLFAGEISKENIDSNGRFRMWEEAERKFYEGNKLTGSGSGVLQSFMYSQGKEEFHGAKIIHNDYIQMKCDNGLIGFWLFLLTELSMVVHCMLVFRQSDDRWIKICALSAGSSMAGVALTLISDNVVNYSMATLSYPFILYGSMLGLMHNQEDQ